MGLMLFFLGRSRSGVPVCAPLGFINFSVKCPRGRDDTGLGGRVQIVGGVQDRVRELVCVSLPSHGRCLEVLSLLRGPKHPMSKGCGAFCIPIKGWTGSRDTGGGGAHFTLEYLNSTPPC